MTRAIRAVVVERASDPRGSLVTLLDGADGLTVVETATDVEAALRAVQRHAPSAIVLCVDVPGAAELTRRVMREQPTPVIAVIDADTAVTAAPVLAEGAVGAQLRPSDIAGVRRFRQVVAALAEVSVVRRRQERPAMAAPVDVARPATSAPPRGRAVAIAASTGGPAALQELFRRLPADLAAPVVVVQHIVAGFVAGLAVTLQAASSLPIRLAKDGDRLERGTVYLAPDDRQVMLLADGRVRVRPDPLVGGYRPSASVLFSSLAEAYGPAGVAVVLTGMGTDGLVGLHDVHRAGGHVLAQDEASSVVYGMPGAAVQAGLPELTAPIAGLAARIVSLTNKERDT